VVRQSPAAVHPRGGGEWDKRPRLSPAPFQSTPPAGAEAEWQEPTKVEKAILWRAQSRESAAGSA
jgi:hypothetical protein